MILGVGTGSTLTAWNVGGQGQRVAVIDCKYIGGSCPNIACMPSKNIVHSAKVVSDLRQSQEFGVARNDVRVDMSAVRDRKRKMVAGLTPRRKEASVARNQRGHWHRYARRISADDSRVFRDNVAGGNHVTTGRQVPFCLFTDPEFARVGLGEKEARAKGIDYRLFKIPMAGVLRAQTLGETRGFLKALVEPDTDRIIGFTGFGVGAGEIMSIVQVAMAAGLPYTALREAILTHPNLAEGLNPLFASVPSTAASEMRSVG